MKPTNPPHYQDYSNVVRELIEVLSKYEMTYWGWEQIKEAIDKEIKMHTYCSIMNDKGIPENTMLVCNVKGDPIYKVDRISDDQGKTTYIQTIWRDAGGNEMSPF